MPFLAVTASVLSTVTAHADLGDQLFELLADDGAGGDWFGRSVAVSGFKGKEIAIVGAPLDDDNGFDSGSAYLFDITTGEQIAKLLPIDGAALDEFGRSVAISCSIAIVGAWADDDNGDQSGSAYLFDITTGQQIAKLLPEDGAADDSFGYSVAISGATAIVGAYKDDDFGADSGAAYLFDTTTGRQIAKLLPPVADAWGGDFFGFSVAISGTTAVVGCEGDDDNGQASGSAYLFSTTTGQQIAKLLPDDGAALDEFGRSVAISGAIAIVGARRDGDNGFYSGSAYLFNTITGQQIAKLLPDDGAETDSFGYSVATSGGTAIVGAIRDDDSGTNSGSAYLFDTITGQQIVKLLPDNGASGARFGQSVAICNTTALAGARLRGGSAYVFDAAVCTADVSGDGAVGPADLAIILGNWGPVPPGDPIADLNSDGVVGPADLAIVLGNWGPCA